VVPDAEPLASAEGSAMKPTIYLVGKISPHDWRHDLVPRLRGHRHEDGPLDCRGFLYSGPFFEHCDHSCGHGPGSHGVLGEPGLGCEAFDRTTPFRVWQRNMHALRAASAVFAFIETNDAFGSMVELGAAQALRIPSWTLFGPGADGGAMWYSAQGALALRRHGGFTARGVCREELPVHFEAFLRRFAA
jgi:hypothetical protein